MQGTGGLSCVLPTASTDKNVRSLAEYGTFNDVKPEDITLEDDFAGGTVESVAKEGEDDDLLKVEVSFPANGQTADDYDAVGTLKFAAGAMNDELGNSAPEVGSTVSLVASDMGKDGNEDPKQKDEKGDSGLKSQVLKGFGAGIEYSGAMLGKVNESWGKISSFFAGMFNIAGNISSGKWVDAAKNAVGLLKVCGIIPAGPKEITAKDVLVEVNALKKVVSDLNLKALEISKENRENRYAKTDVLMTSINDNCEKVNRMFRYGAELLKNRADNPMNPPAADASEADAAKYLGELRKVMLQEEKLEREGQAEANRTGLMTLTATMNKLSEDLNSLATWVSLDGTAIDGDANPISVFDKLVSMKYNWDSQGYYARVTFRGELDYTLRNAWCAISTFYGADDASSGGVYSVQGDRVKAALEQIDKRGSGMSPEEVRKINQGNATARSTKKTIADNPFTLAIHPMFLPSTEENYIGLYSPSLGITIRQSRVITDGHAIAYNKKEDAISDDKINDYKSRCGSRSVYEDLKYAGLDLDDEQQNKGYAGIAFRQWYDYSKKDEAYPQSSGFTRHHFYQVKVRMLGFDGNVSDKKTAWVSFRETDKESDHPENNIKYYWFDR
ncbi:MAG: hypothetical protein J6S63_07320 [Atopobiaceae bacterium]|nr:hypothetical protein [Atopobiaceae bacterium]